MQDTTTQDTSQKQAVKTKLTPFRNTTNFHRLGMYEQIYQLNISSKYVELINKITTGFQSKYPLMEEYKTYMYACLAEGKLPNHYSNVESILLTKYPRKKNN